MNRRPWLPAVLTALTLFATGGWWLMWRSSPPQPPAEQPPRFEIVNVGGKTILGAEQIAYYDWPTHRIILQPGESLSSRLGNREGLNSGIPFLVTVDGVVCYRGLITTINSSLWHGGHVIDIISPGGMEAEVRIEFRNPPLSSELVIDARSDERVRAALRSIGKLKK